MTMAFTAYFDSAPADDSPRRMLRPFGRKDLAHAFASQGFNKGAEIGVWEGRFSQWLCEANPNLHLICVDPWRVMGDYAEPRKNDVRRMREAFEAAQSRLKPFHVTFLRMTSLQAAQQVPDGSLDFVYIDGNHLRDHVLADLRAWAPKVRSGGIVAGHDYIDASPKRPFIQVQAAVDQYTREHGIDPWFVLQNDKSPSYFWAVK